MAIVQMATFISIGVLASFASGLICLLVVGIKWASSVRHDLAGEENVNNTSRIICARCGTPFYNNQHLGIKDVICSECKWPVCSACALRYPTLWICSACIKTKDSIIEESDCNFKELKQRYPFIDNPARKYGKKENEVKDLLEKLAENILGATFENIKINLPKHQEYSRLLEKYEGVLSLTLLRLRTSIQLIIDGVTSTEGEIINIEKLLRELVKEIIKEATSMSLNKISTGNTVTITSKTYEDLLAIAIINKIIENITSVTVFSNNSSNLSITDERKRKNSELNNLNNIRLETKIMELRNSTLGITSSNRPKLIFPDLGMDYSQANHIGKSWQENWLFRTKNTNSNNFNTFGKKETVTMFVPSPKIHISPRIGDSFVDDLSDLSDLNDSEVEELMLN